MHNPPYQVDGKRTGVYIAAWNEENFINELANHSYLYDITYTTLTTYITLR